jgi:hypothetical protein
MALLGIAWIAVALPANAVEGAVGRTLPGIWVMPQAGVVSSTPGFNFTLMPIGYMGSISGSTEIPIAGSLYVNVSANLSENLLIPQYVYKTETAKVNLSSSFYAPVMWAGGNGSSLLNDALLRSTGNANAGLSDVFFSPLTVGIHFSETNNLAIDTKIFAPTGAYRLGNLSNLGMNEWTIQPNIAHTILWEKRGLELDNYVGFDIYAQNPLTRYTSGTVFHWHGMLLQYFSKTFGIGAIGSNITQITSDSGPLSQQLHGFEGHAWGAGPIILYVMKAEKPGISFQIRWVPEFGVQNLVKGNTLLLGMTFKM